MAITLQQIIDQNANDLGILIDGSVALQDAYNAGNTIITSAGEGSLTVAGTEKFEVTTTRGLLISTIGASGEPSLQILNSGTVANALTIGLSSVTTVRDAFVVTNDGLGIGINLLHTNAGNSDPAISVTNTASVPSLAINQNGNSAGMDVILGASVTSEAMRLVAGNTANRLLKLQSSGGGAITLRMVAGTTGHDLTLPPAQGAASSFLHNNGSGILSWATVDTSVTLQDAYLNGTIISTDGTGDFTVGGTEKALFNAAKGVEISGTTGPQPSLNVIQTLSSQHGVSIAANSAVGKSALTASMSNGTGNAAIEAISAGNYGIHVSGSPSNGIWVTGATFRGAYIQNSTASAATIEAKNSNVSGPIMRLDGATSGQIDIKVPAAITTHVLTLPGAQGAASTFLQNNGSGILSWAAASPSPTPVKTANYNAVNYDEVLTDTSGGSFTVFLPSSPTAGQKVKVIDAGPGSWFSNNLTIDRNGENINGVASNTTATEGQSFEFIYVDGTLGWLQLTS